LRYVKTFVTMTPIFTLLYHSAASHRLDPLSWQDAFIIGGATAMLAAFVVLRVSIASYAWNALSRAVLGLARWALETAQRAFRPDVQD